MVSGSRFDGETQILSARVRKTIQSIKEIVGNHSDADIYSMLKETNMDPNETTQKLLNQDPFHEVKRKRDKKKENTGYKGSAESRKHIEHTGQGMNSHTFSDRNARRGGYTQNALHAALLGGVFPTPNVNKDFGPATRVLFGDVWSTVVLWWWPGSYARTRGCAGEFLERTGGLEFEQGFGVELSRVPHVYGGVPFIGESHETFVQGLEGATMAGEGPEEGISREFRIVRDNRVNQNRNREIKPASHQCSTSTDVQEISSISEKSSTGILSDQKHSGTENSCGQKPSQALNGPTDSHPRHARVASINGPHRKELLEETRATVPTSATQVQGLKPHDSQPYSATLASKTSVVGVYSSYSDPVHVPSPDSRSSSAVGAIKREVGVVGVRRQSSENSAKGSSVPSSSFSNPVLGKNISASTESSLPVEQGRKSALVIRPPTTFSKGDQLTQTTGPESVMSNMTVKSFLSNQYSSKPHQQLVGHQKVPQPNKEWKPKSSQKSRLSSPGVIETAATPVSPPTDNSRDSKTESAQLQEKLSQVSIFENQHVIIPQHLRVPEADRTRLTFGSFGAGFDCTKSLASGLQEIGSGEESSVEPSAGLSISIPAAPSDNAYGDDQVDLLDNQARNSGPDSPTSAAASEHPVPDKEEASSPRNSENYSDIGLVRNDSPFYTSVEPQQQQDPPGLPRFSAYDPQTGYDIPFFRPAMDDNVRGQGLPSPQEGLNLHTANSISSSTIAMVQQPVAPMYPQVHVSHFANMMPYRQFLSPVYVPPMAMPGYSSNPAYPHPSNGSSYLLMPGGSSHLAASGLKYGTQQFKPIPAGSPTGFGNFTSPAGYAINAPGAVGSATGLEDSTRIKYKEGSIYIPNSQAETSEYWIQNPRDLPGLQSAPYYNMAGQAQHAAYLQSHTGHASFNAAAAAAAQSTHMQYPGLYHPSPQQAAIANPHHMVPNMSGNVGVGMAAASPVAQVGAYQQPQLGRLNWTPNF
ncbi:hypothetical protein HHK36_014360 [Tetracentron sinense]|uniref:GBF-interacting protein 1 N-terminal domain-containing protein n=1 Tax=Tetracentron sinense TaxID=13715 RepID=A0A835DHM7_TETSI|nr:hypothetical protein HHK36_014360 [Tetracentron sinense]